MQTEESEDLNKVNICGIKIFHHGDGCYCFSISHTGQFRLQDYEELDLEVKSVKLVREK